MNCVICGNLSSDSKTLNLSEVGASTICHILGIREDRQVAVTNLKGCKICVECSENIKDVYLTLHRATKVSVEIDEWRMMFFQKLGSDSRVESETKKQRLLKSSVKVQKRHELTKSVRSHIRRELRVDKKAEKITSLRKLEAIGLQQHVQPMVLAESTVSFGALERSLTAAEPVQGLQEENGVQDSLEVQEILGEVSVEYGGPFGKDMVQPLSMGFYTEREMEQELEVNAASSQGNDTGTYTLRILDNGVPLGQLEPLRDNATHYEQARSLRKIAPKRKAEDQSGQGYSNGLDDAPAMNKMSKKPMSPNSNRRKQTIKHTCYDFKRTAAASATDQVPPSATQRLQEPPLRVSRSATAILSSGSRGRNEVQQLPGITAQSHLQHTQEPSQHSRPTKAFHSAVSTSHKLPKLGFGQSIVVTEDDDEMEVEVEDPESSNKVGEIVDVINYKAIMNGDDDDEDDDDEDYYNEDYEAEHEESDTAAKVALQKLAALGCDIEHISIEDCNESIGLSAPTLDVFEKLSSAVLKNVPLDIVNVESPNINCEDSSCSDDVIIVVGTDMKNKLSVTA